MVQVMRMGKVDDIYNVLLEWKASGNGISASELSERVGLDRTNVSRYLNQLCNDKLVEKINGRPVLYRPAKKEMLKNKASSLDMIVGADRSLQVPIQQAKAAVLYPPRGLHTLILGETGVGKSMFAEVMYQFARETKMIAEDAPFIRFNCADYADNPQLVMAQIFGVKKGAYSGAESDRDGLLKKADQGIFFLDEVHRLSPQGQEMLFTFIDKGYFRPLGETGQLVYAEVQLIAATTEDPQSHLLKTFTRRIPMTITLPSLNERSLEERYFLIGKFIRSEAKRLEKDIYVQYNALISLLLYDCPNNIGQLKSDIQLACAKAFLRYKSENRSYILIDQAELHARVKRGILNLQERRTEINTLLTQTEDILVFSHQDKPVERKLCIEAEAAEKGAYFYDIIESKLEYLKKRGFTEPEIHELLNVDIESYFRKYISDLPEKFRKEEIAKVVDMKIVNAVEEVLAYAEEQLNREYDEKVYYGLALHLNKSIERIRAGTYIYHPQLDKIRKQSADEFLVAIKIAKMIDMKLDVEIPLDEIGYLTMFLASSVYQRENKHNQWVQVLVIMHGHATASSMAQVANHLLGEKHAHSLDMVLNMKVEKMYEQAKEKILEIHNGKGVLLLVDMGSLSNFADMLTEDTGIPVKCIDMVSTPVVIEACRKALAGCELSEVYRSCQELGLYRIQRHTAKKIEQELLIITACFTGEGAALHLKELIGQSLKSQEQIQIKAMDILDHNDFLCRIQELSKHHRIIAIVGTVNVPLEKIPSFSASDVLAGDGLDRIAQLVQKEQEYVKIKRSLKKMSLKKYVRGMDVEELFDEVREIIDELEKRLNLSLPGDVKIGMLLHIGFLVDKLVHQGKATVFVNVAEYKRQHTQEFKIAQQSFKELEERYQIKMTEDEIAYIVKMCLENDLGSDKQNAMLEMDHTV
ncbi:Transcriptional regulatory protein LevR, contains PRD, AAA+ and EIIA domains [Propionispora vibrioides]|uniref:Transcriptional regulatory protein LevR, contains PRD, AAA+ and EIIA domains n=2 Tax=Propionispora vibrioides TaxID=112903 RepID=A0A1H8Y6R1_9FIRM|nr:Transcriptional regulatory protein LevR, contains PRD, AAA+ and EIIA domains [Propionispora vibrioides]